MEMILYGIPNCDTVRKARKFLENHQVEYQFIDFRKDGLTLDTIKSWLNSTPIEVIVNKRSTGWKQLNDDQKTELMNTQNIELLAEIPTLIKRPVLQKASEVSFGFKADEYEKLIST